MITTKEAREVGVYFVWTSARYRCNNKNSKDYYRYGGRGIKMCKRWNKFEKFWEDMGPTYKPGLTLDRIDNNLGYYKENCRWATWEEQFANRGPYMRIALGKPRGKNDAKKGPSS